MLLNAASSHVPTHVFYPFPLDSTAVPPTRHQYIPRAAITRKGQDMAETEVRTHVCECVCHIVFVTHTHIHTHTHTLSHSHSHSHSVTHHPPTHTHTNTPHKHTHTHIHTYTHTRALICAVSAVQLPCSRVVGPLLRRSLRRRLKKQPCASTVCHTSGLGTGSRTDDETFSCPHLSSHDSSKCFPR